MSTTEIPQVDSSVTNKMDRTPEQPPRVEDFVTWLRKQLATHRKVRRSANCDICINEPVALELRRPKGDGGVLRRLALPVGTKATIYSDYTEKGNASIVTFFLPCLTDEEKRTNLAPQITVMSGLRVKEKLPVTRVYARPFSYTFNRLGHG